ncbi:hypothetical protein KDW20_33650 [Burkholderia cenocepacia]|uniref:hypothetical protein n=1 Tax=Burkholderia cenocepacia TaxID=95486 RepID=UPI000F5A558F|nr:hypothetical protein [Burkholderia cenocepacia]MBR8380727.1 hypothetical protein [Burkholderia cenocepacia]RQU63882.1 hypothetical protein DF143_07005 [Burkholderia cenocepacia]
MKKIFGALVAAAYLASSAASAQTFQANNINLIGKLTNVGRNAMSVGNVQGGSVTNPDVSPIFIGPNAGAAYSLTNPWAVGIGASALMSINQPQAEVTAVGTMAAQYLTTGNWNAAYGVHALGSETTGSTIAVFGNDSARNAVGGGSYTGLGNDSVRNGQITNVIGIGNGAMHGNGSAITIAGVPTAGDVLSTTMSTSVSDVTNSPQTASYTVKAGDTLMSAAQGLAAAIMANPLQGKQTGLQAWVSPISGGPATILLDFPGTSTSGWTLNVTTSVSSGATETMTVTSGTKAQSVIAIGDNTAYGAGSSNPNHDVLVGHNIAPFITTGYNLVCIGDAACAKSSNDHDNVIIGANAGASANGSLTNVLIGSSAAAGLTTGSDNVSIGSQGGDVPSQSCITTGAGNIQIGRNTCVPSPTGNGQLSIQNIIYGTSNNGYRNVVSAGNIGIGEPNPQARFQVTSPSSSPGWAVFRLRNSSGQDLLTVQPDGSTFSSALARADLTGLGGDVGNQLLYTPSQNGFFCAAGIESVTTAASSSSTLPSVWFLWTDPDTGAVHTYTSGTNNGNTVNTFNQTGQVCFYAKAGAGINFQTSGYASSGGTPMQFSLRVRLFFGGN